VTIHRSLHDGGPTNAAGQTVTADGSIIMIPAHKNRRYCIIFWPMDATEPVFLRLHQTEPAIIGTGIVIYPGGWHEIEWENMYYGPIRAVTAETTRNTPYWHEGY
jgi:hypothetical protein